MNNAKIDIVSFPILSATILIGLMISFVIYFMILYRKKQRHFFDERKYFKQALIQTEVEIKEQTLSNISRELHDNLGQIASLIKINLNLLTTELPPDDKTKINDSLALLKQMIRDIRQLSVGLNGDNISRFGLVGMIENDISRYRRITPATIDYKTNLQEITLPVAYQIFLYRIQQEVFNNIMKHAKASHVKIHLTTNDNKFRLLMADNGVGFDPSAVKKGAGLENIKERCRMIGASFAVNSNKISGTEIIILIHENGNT